MRAFQKEAGIRVDGIIGPITWGKLYPPAKPVSKSAGCEARCYRSECGLSRGPLTNFSCHADETGETFCFCSYNMFTSSMFCETS